MKKILSVIAIVLVLSCLLGVFAACSSKGGISFKKAKIKVDHTEPTVISSANISEVLQLSGTTNFDTSNNGVLVLTRKLNDQFVPFYSLYNAGTGAVLAENTKDTFSLYSYEENAFYLRSVLDEVNNKYSTTLYNAKGEAVKFLDAAGAEQEAYVSDAVPAVQNVSMDVFSFADNYFRADQKGYGLKRIRRISGIVDFAYNFTDSNDKYYYQIQVNQRRALIFDKNLDLVTTYYAHGDFDDLRIFVMESGDLLVQTSTALMDEEKSYTYIAGGVKTLLKTYIVKAKSGDVSEKKFEYRVQNLTVVSDDNPVTMKAENVALLYPIEDERLLNNATDAMYVSLTNALSVKGRIDKMIDNQIPGSFPGSINGYLIFRTATGRKLVTTSGKVIGDFAFQNNNETFFNQNGKFYDFNLKMLLDYQKEGYAIEYWMNHAVILSKNLPTGKIYYRFDASMTEPVEISTATDTVYTFNRYFYCVRTTPAGEAVYTYYNEKGEALAGLPSTALVSFVASNADKEFMVYKATLAGVEHYYRISK